MSVTGAPEERLPFAWGTPDYEQQTDGYRLGWLHEVVQEGDRINQEDPASEHADTMIDYVMGRQLPTENRPSYLPEVVVNETKRSIRRHASALTDVKPVWGYRTFNANWQQHAQMLNQLTIAWWINTFADLTLVDVIKYAATIGTGDVAIEFDPYWGAGEQVMTARDYRDTLPYRPGRSPSIQQWRGAVLREEHSVQALRAAFPDKAYLLVADAQATPWGRGVFSKFRRALAKMRTPAGDGLDHLRREARTGRATGGGVTMYRMFFKDASVNMSSKPILMGEAGRPWSYMVPPGQKLYPRGRLMVATERTMLYDGPNQFWHGMVPAARLRLDPWPFNFCGLGIAHDQNPTQDAINRMANDFISTFDQWAHRGMVIDKNAMPDALARRLDTRKPGWKAMISTMMGKGIEVVDGPSLPPWAFEFFSWMVQKHGEMSGTANLEILQQLKQMPSEGTIQKFFEALTPELRLEGRYVELFLREVAEQVKFNFFQFYPTSRREQILGEAGISLRDFDFSPGNAIPSMDQSEGEAYIPQLDKARSEGARAEYFAKQFTFFITPNSVLALNAQEEQLKYLTFARMGFLDMWTLAEKFDIPNFGEPPALPLPMLEPPTEDPLLLLATNPGKYTLDPATGQLLEIRKPTTVIEKLLAQQILGLAMATGPAGATAEKGGGGGGGGARPGAGRKASGESGQQMETKKNDDGTPRQTVTESSGSRNS